MRRINLLVAISIICFSCQSKESKTNEAQSKTTSSEQDLSKLDTATFAGGCFWCVEASIECIKGVTEVVSGYAGGSKSNADYRLVSSGKTKHAESVQVYFDPSVITYETLLDIFFTAHDPTQVNRQGPDVGYQYRTAIFYHDAEQKMTAENKINEIQPNYSNPIATELNPYTVFYLAEYYHQDYEKNHPFDPYVMSVSKPKIDRVKKKFSHLLKEEGN